MFDTVNWPAACFTMPLFLSSSCPAERRDRLTDTQTHRQTLPAIRVLCRTHMYRRWCRLVCRGSREEEEAVQFALTLATKVIMIHVQASEPRPRCASLACVCVCVFQWSQLPAALILLYLLWFFVSVVCGHTHTHIRTLTFSLLSALAN